MAGKHALLAITLIAAAWALPTQASACSEAEAEATIKDLGYWAHVEDNWHKFMPCLGEHGQFSAGLLVKELHPVTEKDISVYDRDKHKAGMHVIWCIRGLRYLTGLNFMAGSAAEIRKQKLSENREYWILFQSGNYVRFYGTWMSRDWTFIAPKDVQVAVIAKWKDWYAANGTTYTYRTNSNFDDWYF